MSATDLRSSRCSRRPTRLSRPRSHGEIGVEDQQHLAIRLGESQADRVTLSGAGLAEEPRAALGLRRHRALDCPEGVVPRVTFHKNQLGAVAGCARRADAERQEDRAVEDILAYCYETYPADKRASTEPV